MEKTEVVLDILTLGRGKHLNADKTTLPYSSKIFIMTIRVINKLCPLFKEAMEYERFEEI